MRQRLLLAILLFFIAATSALAERDTVRNEGLNFVPAEIVVSVGDILVFDIDNSHNVVEVSQSAWEANENAPLDGGFELPSGGGELLMEEEGIFYYICQPHIGASMKGVIRVRPAGDVYVAELSGQQVTVPVLSEGSGEVEAVLTEDGQLVIRGSFEGLSSPYTMSHFHIGLAGTNGGVAFGLDPDLEPEGLAGTFDEVIEVDETVIEQLQNRELYVNIHSQNHPGGELRGQVVPEAEEIYYTKLMGSMEVPPVMSDGIGSLVLEVHEDALVVTGSFSGLSTDFDPSIGRTGAHLHGGLAGTNGGILVDLTPILEDPVRGGTFTAEANTFDLTDDLRDAMADRSVYANLHTTGNPAGEIRGQVHPYATSVWRAYLNGPQEVPPVNSAGSGQVLLEVNGSDLTVSGSFSGLVSDFNTGVGAHIHGALAGANGGVVVPLSRTAGDDPRAGTFLADDNEATLTDEQLDTMFARAYYVNIHTDSFPAGEIRGQILPQAQHYFQSLLSGTQHVGGVATDGYGVAIAEVLDGGITLSGSFDELGSDYNTEIAGGAHLHYGLAGKNGTIAVGLNTTVDEDSRGGAFAAEDNAFEIAPTLLDSLKNRALYLNVHSLEIPSGEIRGQMLPEAVNYFIAPLSGASEVPPVNSSATGVLVGEWNGVNLTVTGSFTGLGSPVNTEIAGGAHLHAALPGQNKGIRQVLDITFSVDDQAGEFLAVDNTFSPGATLGDSLRARLLYANIHTIDFPGGELRGQLRAPAQRYLTTFAQGLNEIPPEQTTGLGALNLELNGDRLVGYGAFSGLVGDFDGEPGGGSHLHYGTAATTGGVAVGLNASPENDTAGVYRAIDNVFTLDATQRDSLIGKNLYYNLHTTAVRSGEIRGLMLPESNGFPDSVAITSPPSDASVTIEGDSAIAFVAEWDAGTDPDMDSLVYVWQLAADASFDAPLVSVNVGGAPRFETDYGTVAAILQDEGVSEGQTVTVYHRALASDGSLLTTGAADSVNLTLGIVTDLDDVLARQFQVSLYPVPTRDWLQVEVLAEERAQAVLQLFDQQGRMLGRYPMELFAGENQQRLDLSRQPAGQYILQLLVEGKPVPARQFLVLPD